MIEALEVVRSNDEVAVHGGNMVGGEGEMMELEMEDGVEKIDRPPEFTRAEGRKREKLNALGRRTKTNMEKEMSKKIFVLRHPKIADKLLQIGLLEGYDFYDVAWLEGNCEQPQS
ncbi:UNVERIFIED_CONTAM: hypothetical protein Sradi_7252500, partial [Sesamum radiatum]